MNRDYRRIETAIRYLTEQFPAEPDLEKVALKVHLSPYHFQRLFTRWAGVSPKKFCRYLSSQRAKSSLAEGKTLFDTAHDAGLSGTGRLHDLFVTIEGMTPGSYKNGGRSLTIRYSVNESLFGDLLIASTDRGICKIAFIDEEQTSSPGSDLKAEFPEATFLRQSDSFQQAALKFFSKEQSDPEDVRLCLKGTPFQIKVWDALINIPEGQLRNYSEVAEMIGNPKASRAVGSAIAKNPVAWMIPCHRVIKSTGEFGNYRWGSDRKTAMIGWEAAKVNLKRNDTVT